MTLAAGVRLGPYEVLGPLGAGGMGEVYRARDTRLGREVALKVLPAAVASDERRLRRFEQEARSASALNHPNIVTIHDVGETDGVPWIAMERVEGASLRQRLAAERLPLEQALAIGLQVAQGLARAHAAGVVHRDLKPENVMVTPEGRAKILDFGLAKAAPGAPPDGSQAETATQATEAGTVVGTVGYMSPEQATGRAVDHRSDQFALGAILYELATGRRAFQRASAVETLSAILREEPAPLRSLSPDVPEPLDRIVRRCLSKDPAGRYDSTQDLALDLAAVRDPGALAAPASHAPARRPRRAVWLGLTGLAAVALAAVLAAAWIAAHRRAPSGAASDRDRSIAVLPFQNVGGRPEDEYFADGMTDSLITEVARVRELLVIARNSAFHYKGAAPDVRAVGEKLGVRYVLEGSVQRAGDSVRVNAQLVDAATGFSLWAEKYDRPLKEIFALQDDISGSVVAALRLALRPSPRPGRAPTPTPNLEAYDAFLRGTFFANAFAWSEKDKAIPHLERAVALDPGFADARAALAQQYARKAFERDSGREWEQKAFVEVEKALALDPGLARAYLVRADLSWTLANHFPHEQSGADLRRAIEINPSFSAAHGALGSLYLHVGLLDRSLAEYALALKADPNDLDSRYRIPRVRLYQQRYAEALDGFQATPEFRDDFQVPLVLAHLGRIDQALAIAGRESPSPKHAMEAYDRASTRAVVFALARDRRAAESSLAAAQAGAAEGSSHFHHAAYAIACAHALLGRKAEALAWLRRTAEDGMPCYPLFAKDPFLDGLRGEPEFEAFLKGLRGEWERLSKVL